MAMTQRRRCLSGTPARPTATACRSPNGCSRSRPAGALVIVVFVWVVFAVLSTARGDSAFYSIHGTLGYLDVAAQVGIIGTAVALLMIAGEFDLSVGSMVGFAGIMIGICVDDLGPADLAVDRHRDGPDHGPRRDQRHPRRPDRPAVVHRHPGDAVHHRRRCRRS